MSRGQWTMDKGGVLVKNPVSAPGPPLSKILDPPLSMDILSGNHYLIKCMVAATYYMAATT